MNRAKLLTRTALHGLYKYSGAAFLQERISRWAGWEFGTILIFHRVTDAIPPDVLTVSTKRFEQVCRMLRRGFRVVPLGEMFDLVRSRRPIPPRTVAITFDDCYRDNLFAARKLAQHHLPATFFIPTAFVGTDHVFDWDRHLPRMPNLTWAEVREMAGMGFEIGSHTVSHPNLGRIPLDEGKQEITESKRILEQRLGRPVRWLAYPFGGVDAIRPELVDFLDEAGYDGCVSAFGGFVLPGCDPRILPRTPVPAFANMLHLELHLTGSLNWTYTLKCRLGWMQENANKKPTLVRGRGERLQQT